MAKRTVAMQLATEAVNNVFNTITRLNQDLPKLGYEAVIDHSMFPAIAINLQTLPKQSRKGKTK